MNNDNQKKIYQTADGQEITSVEDMRNIAFDIVRNYCVENDVKEDNIKPLIWIDIIAELYNVLFKPCNKLLRKENAQYGEYDISKIEYIYNNIYKRLCYKHGQEVYLKAFCDMVGVGTSTINDWSSGRLNSQRSDLQQKISQDNEESLFALMKDSRINPMKILPKLNKVHGWNMPGTRSQLTDTEKALCASELPKLGYQNPLELSDNLEQCEGSDRSGSDAQFDTI